MDLMVILQIIVLFGGIFLGIKIGGMGVGYAGGLGVIVMTLFLGMDTKMSYIPLDVILIIASVISAITALQVAGGLDYLVQVNRKNHTKAPQTNQLHCTDCGIFSYDFGWDRTHGIFDNPCYRGSGEVSKYQA